MSRVTQGVRLINLREGQKVSSISVVNTEEQNSDELNESENISDNSNTENISEKDQ